MNDQYLVKTVDMHTAGEPLRIIESIEPQIKIEGKDILETIDYMKNNLDWIRTLVIDEPRGHRDMYGALLFDFDISDEFDFGVIFLHNNGYSTMCGHGVIALARYAIDKKLIKNNNNSVRIMCPCGVIECKVSKIDSTVYTTFKSVPAFLLYRKLTIEDLHLGRIVVDIAYGGAFYAIVHENELGLRIKESDLCTVVNLANKLKVAINNNIKMEHAQDARLEFLYGIIVVKDMEDNVYKNIVIFANKEVDRSPCGSGVTARMAALYFGKNKNKTFLKPTSFQNSLLKEKSHFTAKIVEERRIEEKNDIVEAVRVEITGSAFYTGRHEFICESNDPLKYGFKMYL